MVRHCINFAQNVSEIARLLPHFPKDLPILIVRKNGKDNRFKDIRVHRQNVLDALNWLTSKNPQYSDIWINYNSLNSLPIDGIPLDLPATDSKNETVTEDDDLRLVSDMADVVHNEQSEISSFMPNPPNEEQEKDAILQQFSSDDSMA